MPNVGKIRIGEGPDDVVVIFDSGAVPLHVDLVTELAEERAHLVCGNYPGRRRTEEGRSSRSLADERRYRLCIVPGSAGVAGGVA